MWKIIVQNALKMVFNFYIYIDITDISILYSYKCFYLIKSW